MIESIIGVALGAAFCAASYLFVVTRGALIAHALLPCAEDRSHIYWVYTQTGLIRFSDRKPLVAGLLLFQYNRLVDHVVRVIGQSQMRDRLFVMTACAFGDVMPRVVEAALARGVGEVCITDLITNELVHANDKLRQFSGRFGLVEADATHMPCGDGSVAFNLLFFLLHELPDASKRLVLQEAARVVEPGGKLLIVEFHRPRPWLFRLLGRCYFSVMEPYALSIWGRYDPVALLQETGDWSCERSTYCFGNFQVIEAKKRK